jgi:nucleoside-diphosphate-sugar epimerase
MLRRIPDISKVTQATGYKPRHGLDEILRQVIDYVKQVGPDTLLSPRRN